MNTSRPLIGAVLALATVSCAAPPIAEEVVVVLPGPEGKTGTVVVQRDGTRQTLDQPYAANRVRGDGQSESARLSGEDVNRQFGETLTALPGRPATFLLYFITGRDELTPESVSDLDRILAEMKSRPVPDVIVTGHTDTVGTSESNDKLSMQRAERVRGFLTGIGIPADRIRTAGRGERELLVPTADNVDEPRNRRVEINVR